MITIKIHVEGGVVIDVKNLPPNCDHEIIDYDNMAWKDYDNRVKMSGDNPTGENDTKSVFNTDNAISKEFEYLQKLIQDFAVKHEIEIKK